MCTRARESEREREKEREIHDATRIPKDGVGVEVLCGIKPKIKLLFSIPLSLSEHIGMEDVRVST